MEEEKTKEEQDYANKVFDSLRDELLKRDLSNTENYDKTIMTLSSATLGLSLTAIKFIVPIDSAEYIWLIECGWLLLLFSITISIVAFQLSNKAIKIQLENAEDYYLKGVSEAFNRKNKLQTINTYINLTTGITFIIALTAIVSFIILNVNLEARNMSKDTDNKKTVSLRESTNIPKMQELLKDTTRSIESTNIPTIQELPTGLGKAKSSSNIPTMQQLPTTPVKNKMADKNSDSNSGKKDKK